MSSPYRNSSGIPSTGDRFDPFDVQVERFVEIITKHVHDRYGGPDQEWLRAVERAAINDPTRVRPTGWTYDQFKEAALRPSLKGIGRRGWRSRDPQDPDNRGTAFNEAKRMLAWYGLDHTEICGTDIPAQFATDKYSRWPYYSAALLLVVERAGSYPHEVHVVPERADRADDQDLREDPLVYVVPSPRREVEDGDRADHREGEGSSDGLAD